MRPLRVKNTFHIGQWSLAGKWLKNKSWQEYKFALKVQHSALKKAKVRFSELLWAIWWNSIDSMGHFGVNWICFAAFPFLGTNSTDCGLLLWPQTVLQWAEHKCLVLKRFINCTEQKPCNWGSDSKSRQVLVELCLQQNPAGCNTIENPLQC